MFPLSLSHQTCKVWNRLGLLHLVRRTPSTFSGVRRSFRSLSSDADQVAIEDHGRYGPVSICNADLGRSMATFQASRSIHWCGNIFRLFKFRTLILFLPCRDGCGSIGMDSSGSNFSRRSTYRQDHQPHHTPHRRPSRSQRRRSPDRDRHHHWKNKFSVGCHR